MTNYGLIIIISYLFAIFVLLLETKLTFIRAGISKLLFIGFAALSLYFLIVDALTNVSNLWLNILIYLPLVYFLFMIFTEDFSKLAKKTGIKVTKEKTMVVNNDLADILYRSVDYLSKNKIGALITVERKTDLSKIINKAMLLNADVSKELLTSIFIPNTPLHDGAVIIRGNKILCAKAYYPSTKRTDLPMHYGTRHRAAIGISEQSDAFTIIVSEETGHVSITVNKEIEYNISKETLNLYFEKFLKIN
ncbi:MAG: diadenylate cyclase [Candidatus Izemoplasmatales bacterium]|jgi:diadenylate cyclase|nr:diadenylate cyclase [Candidatus Izemoplasmatales bacterium]